MAQDKYLIFCLPLTWTMKILILFPKKDLLLLHFTMVSFVYSFTIVAKGFVAKGEYLFLKIWIIEQFSYWNGFFWVNGPFCSKSQNL